MCEKGRLVRLMPLLCSGSVMAAASIAVLAATDAPSTSKIGIHQLFGYTAGAKAILAARPRVLKVLGVTGGALGAMRDYKASTPQGIVVVRIFTAVHYQPWDDPVVSANHFWSTVLAPPLNSLSAQDRALIDYVEGPNEQDNTPTWGSVSDAQWFNTFWLTLSPLIANAGFKPCAFSISVGNPPGPSTFTDQCIGAIVPALRDVKSRGGAWSYHSYTVPYTQDVNQEIWYSLRYRQFYSYFAKHASDLSNMPMILTEGGVDGQAGAAGSGWMGGGDAAKYQNWLAWYDQQIRQDPYILGVTLFQSGDPAGWGSFEIEPIAGWLTNYLLANRPAGPTISLSTSNLNTTVQPGLNAPSQTFTVRNSGSGTLNYNITANRPWLSVLPSSGSSTGETDTITVNYTTSQLAAGTHSATITIADPAASNNPQALSVTVTVSFGQQLIYAVNSGGSAAGAFAADVYFSGGTATGSSAGIDRSGAADPAPEPVYQTERYGLAPFSYTFPDLTPNGAYTVRLHFAEIYFTTVGQRRFNVAVNNSPVLNNFDIVAEAGAPNKAVVRSFPATADSSGRIVVQYTPGSVNNPKSSGIEILVDVPGPSFVRCDFDRDSDVDQADFGRFQACFSGAGTPQNDPACDGAKLDADADVDGDDFGIFQRCLSGPNIPADPNCAN